MPDNVIAFDAARFRAAFPAFSDTTTYPDALLQRMWTTATCIVSEKNEMCVLTEKRRTAILDAMLAHLLFISNLAATGNNVGHVNSATVDKVSVTLEAPKANNQFQLWLNSSPYGQEIRVILHVAVVGGFRLGGLEERRGFRKVNGQFD